MSDLLFLPHKNSKTSYNKIHYLKIEDVANFGKYAEALIKWTMHFMKNFLRKEAYCYGITIAAIMIQSC